MNVEFTLLTVDTTSMINVFNENHYMIRFHRSLTGGTLTRNFIIELLYYLKSVLL
jgi:hypothetical protein